MARAPPTRAVACGLVSSVEAYNPDQDSYTLFVSPCSQREGHSGYTNAQLSRQFGRVLHWMLRDVLGRDVPSWDELKKVKELRGRWRGLFGAHASRTLIATYWGVVREQWAVSKELTNDKISTLQNCYAVFEGWITESRTRSGIEHPDHFNSAVDGIRAGAVIDWATFDPEHPELAIETLRSDTPRAGPVKARRTA